MPINFPTAFRGRTSTNVIEAGTCWAVSRARQKAKRSSSVATGPVAMTTNAAPTVSPGGPGTPTTPASATAGCARSARSTSPGYTTSPRDMYRVGRRDPRSRRNLRRPSAPHLPFAATRLIDRVSGRVGSPPVSGHHVGAANEQLACLVRLDVHAVWSAIRMSTNSGGLPADPTLRERFVRVEQQHERRGLGEAVTWRNVTPRRCMCG